MSEAECIGTITQEMPAEHRQSMEVAAWYRTYRCEPQSTRVYMTRTPEGHPQFVTYAVEGICVDACLVSLFGGVPIGNGDAARERALGEHGSVVMMLRPYELEKEPGLELKPEYEWLLDRSKWRRECANWYIRRMIRGNLRLRHVERQISTDYLRTNGDPELVRQVESD